MVTRQAGLSLIELMVTVVVIGMLAVVTVPFTRTWLDEAAVNNARSQLHRAHGQAKAIALRNPEGKTADDPVAASIKLEGGVLLVCQGKPECSDGDSDMKWRSSWPEDVALTLKVDGIEVSEVQLNNRGQITSSGSNPINTGLVYSLSKGKVTDDDEERNRLR